MKSVRSILGAATALAVTLALLTGASPAAAATTSDPSTVHTYRATPGDTASERYSLTANTKPVFVTKYANRSNNRMHVARFAGSDTTPTLTVTNNAPITSVKIYPERYYSPGSYTVSGNTVTFDMNANLRYAIVEVNGANPGLAIVNDRPLAAGEVPNPDASNVVDVSDYVTDRTGTTDQTNQIRAAIDALYSNASKNTLYFPDGTYTYAGLELRNRTKAVTIYADEGALLKNRIQPTMESMEPAIGIWDSSNITISGRGVFDANGFANYDTSNGGWRHDANTSHHQGGVMVTRSQNIVFNDTLLRDAKQWNWETHTAKNVVFNNIKGLTPYAQPWVDGIDLASGQNVTVNGALTLGNDDTFASGHYNPDDGFNVASNTDRLNWDTEDTYGISVNNHLGWSAGAGNGIRLGYGAYGHQLRDYSFNNVHYLGFDTGDNGINVMNAPDRGTRNYPRYESISVTNSSFDTSKVNWNFRVLGKNSTNATDRIGQVTLDNVWFSNSLAGSVENVTNLKMANMTAGGQKVTRLSQTKWTLTNIVNPTLDFARDSKIVAPVSQDTNIQTWNTEQSANYGDNEHLRLLNFNNSSRGELGQLYLGDQTSQDAKLALLGFDLSGYAGQLAGGTLTRAELSMTYMGATKTALSGTNVLKVARVTTPWVEGNGKTTPVTRTNTVSGATTWKTKPMIDSSVIASSSPFSVATTAKSGSDATYSNSQAVVGGTVTVDVTALTKKALESGSTLSLAINESNKQDIIFVSSEGAARNAAAAQYAPTLTLYIETSGG